MIFLERDEIAELIDFASAATAIEDAYRAASANQITLPPVGHITFPDLDGDCHLKYGHRAGDSAFVVKIATGFPNNDPAVAPTGNGLSLVISAETGQTQAILHDQMLLTDVRTSIGAAIATRSLARASATRMLVVGTGVQSEHQIKAHRALLGRDLDVAIWGRSEDKAHLIAGRTDVRVVSDLAAGCQNAEIIVTVTGSKSPLIQSDWVQPGTHITAVGADAPGKHELDEALLNRAHHLVADSTTQCLDHGDFSALDASRHDEVLELGFVLDHPVSRTADQISIADLTGTAAQDIAIAQCVLAAHAAAVL